MLATKGEPEGDKVSKHVYVRLAVRLRFRPWRQPCVANISMIVPGMVALTVSCDVPL